VYVIVTVDITHIICSKDKLQHKNIQIFDDIFMWINPVVFYAIRKGQVCQNTTAFVFYLLCWRRHVSADVGHLQVTKMYNEENCTVYDH